jgi:hypothetical protein
MASIHDKTTAMTTNTEENSMTDPTDLPTTPTLLQTYQDFSKFNTALKDWVDDMKTIVLNHPGLTWRQTTTNLKPLEAASPALHENRHDLKGTPAILALVSIGARNAAIKEAARAVINRLDHTELQASRSDKDYVTLSISRLDRAESCHKLLRFVSLDPAMEEIDGALDIKDLVSSCLAGSQAGKAKSELPRYYVNRVPEDSTCPIRTLNIKEDPDDDNEGGKVPSPVLSPCCHQPFHPACQLLYLRRGKKGCPLCRVVWSDEAIIETVDRRIAHLHDIEANWRRRAVRDSCNVQ